MFLLFIILHMTIGGLILLALGFRRINATFIGLAFPIGLGFGSVLVFILDVLHIHLNLLTVTGSHIILIGLLYFFLMRQQAFAGLHRPVIRLTLVEIPFLFVFAVLAFISVWRCYYVPITPYDAIQGIDLLAKYAIIDGRLHSHMLDDLRPYLSTQPYYAPFCALSQIIYRLGGLPFGKLWLSGMFLSFTLVFYAQLRRHIHPLLSGILTLALLAIPEMYAYTFMLQTDYSNAIFVSLAIIFLYNYITNHQRPDFRLAALLFGLGAWSRSETIAFSLMTAFLLFIWEFRTNSRQATRNAAFFFLLSFLLFAAWNLFYLPVMLDYSPESYFRFGFWDGHRMLILIKGMWEILTTTGYWGYILPAFAVGLVVNLFLLRDVRNLFVLCWIAGLLVGFFLLLYHLQLNIEANISYTFRRGLFKLFPVVLFYLGTSRMLESVAERIHRFETS